MSLLKKVMTGTLVLALAEGVTYACSFGRNMILARMLSKSDFGIAAAFAMVMTVLEFAGKLAISRFLVQDKDGARPDFLATAHSVQLAASAFSTVAMLITASPLAALFGIYEQRIAFVLLAFFPLIKGFEHLDIARMERDLRFIPSSIASAAPQIVITLMAWPVAAWLDDYRAILVLLGLKGLGTTIASHALAQQRFRWGFNRDYIERILRFGWPLVINGFLIFGVMQGDQFLVASFYSIEDLGTYAAASALAVAPSFIFARFINSLMLPLMSAVQDKPADFAKRYTLCLQTVTAFSSCYAIIVITAAREWMIIAYGVKYADGALILAWLAASHAIRTIRFAPIVAALAKADSRNQLVSNLFRAVSFGPAVLIGAMGLPVWTIAVAGLLGELMACLYSLHRLNTRDAIPWSVSLWPVSAAALVIGAAITTSHMQFGLSTATQVALSIVAAFIVGSLFVLSLRELRIRFLEINRIIATKVRQPLG